MRKVLNKHILFSFCVYSLLAGSISSVLAADGPVFYGQTVDSESKPVGYSTLVLELDSLGVLTEQVVTSDPNGFFEFACEADTVEVKTVFREGYVLDHNQNVRFAGSQSDDPARIFLTQSDKPGIARNSYKFTVWKDTPGEFLIDLSKDRGKKYNVMSEPQKNIPKKPGWTPKSEADSGRKFHKIKHSSETQVIQKKEQNAVEIQDIKIFAGFLESEQVWGVMFSSVSNGTVLQFSDDGKLRCPADGYNQEAALPAGVNEHFCKYVYVKARDGQIYSRLSVDIKSNEQALILSVSNYANAMGSPILAIEPEGALFDSDKEKNKQKMINIENQQRRQRDKERRFCM